MLPGSMSRPVNDLFLTSLPTSVPFRTSLLRTLLLTIWRLPMWSAAYDVPPSATISASVATTFAYDR